MNKLSVVIIAFNEEQSIARCIDSVNAIADEVILLDSFSTDRTVEIARQKGAKIFQQKFDGFTLQKQRAVALAENNFVFSIDADEVVGHELAKSIWQAKQNNFSADAYEMNRLNFFGDRTIKTCGWYPDTKIRIWNRTKGGWQGGKVHEKLVLIGVSSVEKLNGDLLHYTYADKAALIKQQEKFARLAAEDLKKENAFYLLLKMIFSPPFKFIRNYFFKLGFTDGTVGFTICKQLSRGVFLKYYYALAGSANPTGT